MQQNDSQVVIAKQPLGLPEERCIKCNVWAISIPFLLDPLNPKSDQHLISPYINTVKSHITIMRIKGNDHQTKKLYWLLDKFSLSVPKEMYREVHGEYRYWCLGKKE